MLPFLFALKAGVDNGRMGQSMDRVRKGNSYTTKLAVHFWGKSKQKTRVQNFASLH
jgi:hypothetical protein